jgi:hypothetical protein
MRWKVRENKVPELGDRRTRLKFAWGRYRIKNHYIWLENFWVTEEYQRVTFTDTYGPIHRWVPVEYQLADYY